MLAGTMQSGCILPKWCEIDSLLVSLGSEELLAYTSGLTDTSTQTSS